MKSNASKFIAFTLTSLLWGLSGCNGDSFSSLDDTSNQSSSTGPVVTGPLSAVPSNCNATITAITGYSGADLSVGQVFPCLASGHIWPIANISFVVLGPPKTSAGTQLKGVGIEFGYNNQSLFGAANSTFEISTSSSGNPFSSGSLMFTPDETRLNPYVYYTQLFGNPALGANEGSFSGNITNSQYYDASESDIQYEIEGNATATYDLQLATDADAQTVPGASGTVSVSYDFSY
jgi:hypothetical protein